VCPGYWRDDANTAAQFVTIPVTEPPTRFYKTGDLVKRLPSGDYAYLRRIDDQIKVLGYRVELGDIEAAVRTFEGITETAAVAWPVVEGSAHGIVAFVSGPAASLANLRPHLTATLPSYMVPRRILVVDDFPRNINGKIDRRALREYLETSNDAIVRVHASY
jgi:acyl-coenzyme A synthetase/AMP-(fatty) acid ligase